MNKEKKLKRLQILKIKQGIEIQLDTVKKMYDLCKCKKHKFFYHPSNWRGIKINE